jgi:hypothetical protein
MSLEIDRIKQLCIDYEKHLTKQKRRLTYFEIFKRDLTKELLKHGDNPQKILKLLEEPSQFLDSPTSTKAKILRMNRNTPISWFFKGLMVLITAPISLPVLMLWSLKTRGTINFFKAEGAIFLDKLIPICQSVNELPPDSSTKRKTKVRIIPISKGRTPMKHLFLTTRTQKPEELITQQKDEPVDLQNMSQLAGQVANIFDPKLTMHHMLKNFNGQAMIIASEPIQKTNNPNQLRLRFTCELMYTGTQPTPCDITLFKTFSPMSLEGVTGLQLITSDTTEEQPTLQYPWIQGAQEYCLSFFKDSFASMMKKGHEETSDFFMTIKYYEQALTLAKTNSEKLIGIEHIVNYITPKLLSFKYGPLEHFMPFLEKKIEKALKELPANYRVLSVEVNNINHLYQTIWSYLENNETNEAWKLFQTITLSDFIKKTCTDIDAMYFQLYAVFQINGEDEQLEDGAISAAAWLHGAYRRLSQQNYSLCLMTEYNPSLGAEIGKVYLQESQHSPLNYVIRNQDNTDDLIGQITQEELIINGIDMGYSSGCSQDFIDKLGRSIPRIIATLVDKGHASQPRTPEARLMRKEAIQAMGEIQLLATKAWQKTPPHERSARAHALDQRKTSQIWQGQLPQIRIDKDPRYFSKESLKTGQWAGSIDPTIRYIDDIETTNTSSNSNLTWR